MKALKFTFGKIFFLFSLFFTAINHPILFAQDSIISIDGEAEFLSRASDDWSMVKKHLFALAVEDGLNKAMKEMGLDNNVFWNKFNQRFEDSLKTQETTLKAKYGITSDKDIEKHPKYAQYESELRDARLNARSKFGNLQRVILGHSERKQSRSTANPNIRFYTLGLKIDRKGLQGLYHRYSGEGKSRQFSKIYLGSEFVLKGVEWQDIGVETATELTSVVEGHWKKWLEENLHGQISELSVLNPGDRIDLEKNFKSAHASFLETGLHSASDTWSEEYQKAAWLKMIVRLTNVPIENSEGLLNIKVECDYILLDIKTGDILLSDDFQTMIQPFRSARTQLTNEHEAGQPVPESVQTISSNVASAIYRMPVTSWANLSKTLGNLQDYSGRVNLEIQQVSSINHVYGLIDYLTHKGAGNGVIGTLQSFDGKDAKISLRYQGENEGIINFLKSQQNGVLGKGLSIHFEDIEKPFKISLKGSEAPATN